MIIIGWVCKRADQTRCINRGLELKYQKPTNIILHFCERFVDQENLILNYEM